MSEDFVVREQNRQVLITKAVEAAEAVLREANETDPDVSAYIWYKTGAQLLMKGLSEGIDRRVMLSDMGLTKLVTLDPAVPIVSEHAETKCHCGRDMRYEPVAFNSEDMTLVCTGCFDVPRLCRCIKLSSQVVSKTAL